MGSFYIPVVEVGIACLALVAFGYILSYFKIMKPKDFSCLNKFSAVACFPFLLYRSLAAHKLRQLTFAPLVNALLMSASTQVFCTIIFLFPLKDKLYTYLATVISSAYINYVIIGIPIFESIWGDTYNQIPAICSFCHYILLVPIFILLAQLWHIKKTKEEMFLQKQNALSSAEDEKDLDEFQQKLTWKDVLMAFVGALKTPLVIGNFVGLIWSAIGLDYPTFFNRIGQYFGDGVVVFALICIGGFLQMNSIFSCHWLQLISCLVIRFLVCPGFSCLFAYVLHIDHRLAKQCVVLTALPAANAGFILANSTGIGSNIASAMVFWTLLFIVPVLMLWFYIFDSLHIFEEPGGAIAYLL